MTPYNDFRGPGIARYPLYDHHLSNFSVALSVAALGCHDSPGAGSQYDPRDGVDDDDMGGVPMAQVWLVVPVTPYPVGNRTF